MRLDLLLVEKKLAVSRSHAQQLIAAGQVFLREAGGLRLLRKASLDLPAQVDLLLEEGPANRYVSRGGLKLEGALRHLGLSVRDLKVLDVGISTGGFSDCLLQEGVAGVFGVDVGHGQLSPRLAGHPRLRMKEGVNARNLAEDPEVGARKFDLIVMDVSFISVTLILEQLPALLRDEGLLLSLVKPQFEVGAEGLGKGGIVKDTGLYAAVEKKIRAASVAAGFAVLDYFASPIEGKEGNREFFIFARKTTSGVTVQQSDDDSLSGSQNP